LSVKIFRQSSRDLYAAIVCAAYPALLVACAVVFWDVPLGLQLALVLALSVLWQSGSYAYHFHNHANFFVSPALNRAFEVLCSAAWKMPVSREAYYHFIHHTPRFLATRDSYDGTDPLLGTLRHCGLSSPRTLFYNAFDWFGLRWLLGVPYLSARLRRGGASGGTLTDPKFFSWHRKSDDEPWEFTAFALHRGQLRQVLLECGAIFVFNAVLLLIDPVFYVTVYAPLHFVAYFIYDYMDFSEHFLAAHRARLVALARGGRRDGPAGAPRARRAGLARSPSRHPERAARCGPVAVRASEHAAGKRSACRAPRRRRA
jgi:hypothetical protein